MLVINSNSFEYNLDDYLEKKIAFVYSNLNSVKQYQENNIYYVSSQEILYLILNDKNIGYDVLIFDLLDSKDFYSLLIFNVIKIKKIDIQVIVYNHYPNLPFEVKKKEIKTEISEKDKIKVNYHKNGYKIKERFEMLNEIKEKLVVSKLRNKNILVVVPGERESQYLYRGLKSLRKDHLDVYILNDNINQTKFKKYSKNGTTTVLIMEANNLVPLPYDEIEVIYDCYMRNFNKFKITYLYQQHLDLLKTYLYNGEINLMVTNEFFKNSPQIGIPLIPYYDVYKYYLMIVKNNLNPEKVFNNIIMNEKLIEIKETLTNLNLLNKKRVTIDIEDLFSYKLSLRTSLILNLIIEKKDYNIYPFIVLVSIIENIKYVDDKDNLIGDPLVFYLQKWLDFSNKFQDLDVEKNKIKNWTQDNNLNFYVWLNILEKVKEIIDCFDNRLDVEIGFFDIYNLLQKANPYLEKSYKDYIFHLKDRIKEDEYIYTNNKDLVKIKKYNLEQYPNTVVSFFQHKNNKKNLMNEIIFYTII